MPYDVTVAAGYQVSDDQGRLDVDRIHRFLAEDSYWTAGRTRQTTDRSFANSLCFGLYAPGGSQAGFARVVTDRTISAHLADVFVLPGHRGRGLGKSLVRAVLAHPDLATVTRWSLTTRDAHALYAGFGFRPVAELDDLGQRMMVRQTGAATGPMPLDAGRPST